MNSITSISNTVSVSNANLSSKELIAQANNWRKNTIKGLFGLILIWDKDEARRALKVQSISDWSWKGRKLFPKVEETFKMLLTNLNKVAPNPKEEGFSVSDLEYFTKYYRVMHSDRVEAMKALEAEYTTGKSPLSADDMAKSRIEMHFERSKITRLIDTLSVEIGRRIELAKAARAQAEADRQARIEEEKLQAEAKAQQAAVAEQERVAYLQSKIDDAKRARNRKDHYVPAVARKETKLSGFGDLIVLNRKQGVFVSIETVPKSKAVEIAGIDAKAFAEAYKTSKASGSDTIITLGDYRQIAFQKSGAVTKYLVRS
jgi:hypothetical protein